MANKDLVKTNIDGKVLKGRFNSIANKLISFHHFGSEVYISN